MSALEVKRNIEPGRAARLLSATGIGSVSCFVYIDVLKWRLR